MTQIVFSFFVNNFFYESKLKNFFPENFLKEEHKNFKKKFFGTFLFSKKQKFSLFFL